MLIWKGLLSPLKLSDLDGGGWEVYKKETEAGNLSDFWKLNADAVWDTLKSVKLEGDDNTPATYLGLLTIEDFKRIEGLSEDFVKKKVFFGVHKNKEWNKLMGAYHERLKPALMEIIVRKTPKDVDDFRDVKSTLQRKLEWIIYPHHPSTRNVIPLPLATPKLLEALNFSLLRIANAIKEVKLVLR